MQTLTRTIILQGLTTAELAQRIATNQTSVQLYTNHSYTPKIDAQKNLQGKIYFCTDDTLKYFGSRIQSSRVEFDGLMLGIIESKFSSHEKTSRAFYYTIFDLYGSTIERKTDGGYPTNEKCLKAYKEQLSSLDPVHITIAAIEHKIKFVERELNELKTVIFLD